MAEHSLIAIVTPAFGSEESIEALQEEVSQNGYNSATEIRLVAPAVELNTLHHTLGDIDEPRVEAKKRLVAAVAKTRAAGFDHVTFEVGDADPVQAAQDALLARPADEVMIYAHADETKDWYEGGLWKHAEDSLEPPLKLVVVEGGPDGNEHVVKVDSSSAGCSNTDAHREVANPYLPGLTRGDLAGMVLGIVGTIVVVILAAVATAGGTATGWPAVAIGIAIATALVNMSNVVGQLLMESVRYRGGFAKFFRDLALIGTPIAILVNLAIVIFA